jgi:predicted AAA+ superfamily ATPase
VNTYIKEEIKEEGVIRSIPPFLRFLNIAGQLNGQIVNVQNIARDANIPRSTVDVYFSILMDTLLGYFLPAYRPKLKVREQSHPKFYWFDSGVARAAAGLLYEPIDRIWQGVSLETLIYHELRVYNQVMKKYRSIYYYRTQSGVEIDFIIETRKKTQSSKPSVVCIEVKSSDKWQSNYEKSLLSIKENDNINVERMYGIYCGERAYYNKKLTILPVCEFLKCLYEGKIF